MDGSNILLFGKELNKKEVCFTESRKCTQKPQRSKRNVNIQFP